MPVVPLTIPVNSFMRLRFDVKGSPESCLDWTRSVIRDDDLCTSITSMCERAGLHILCTPTRSDRVIDSAASCITIFCLKSVTARVFKAVVDWDKMNQQGPQLHVAGIKQHASLVPSDPLELQGMMNACLRKALLTAGWEHLAANRYIKLLDVPVGSPALPPSSEERLAQACIQHAAGTSQAEAARTFLGVAAGSWGQVLNIKVSIQSQAPSAGLLVVFEDAGVSKFSPFNPPSCPANPGGQAAARAQLTLQQALADPAGRRAIVQQANNRQCLLLPEMTKVVVKSVLLKPEDEDGIRQYWLANHQYRLPEPIPFFLEVSASLDDEDALHVVPSCCTWAASTAAEEGFTPVAGGPTPGNIMKQAVQDLIDNSAGFWGVLTPALTSGAQATPAADQANLQPTSGWVSAKDLHACGSQQGHRVTGRVLGESAGFSGARQQDVGITAQHVDFDTERPAAADPDDWEVGAAVQGPVNPGAKNRQDIGKEREAWKRLQSAFQDIEAEEDLNAPKKAKVEPKIIPAATQQQAKGQLPAVPNTRPVLKGAAGLAARGARAGSAAPTAVKRKQAKSIAVEAPSLVAPPEEARPQPVKKLLAAAATGIQQPLAVLPGAPCPSDGMASLLPPASSKHPSAAVPPAVAATATNTVSDLGGPTGTAARQRTKAKDLDLDTVLEKVLQSHASGTLKKLTIPELQAYLRSRKQPVSGKKADLEGRVLALLDAGKPAQPEA